MDGSEGSNVHGLSGGTRLCLLPEGVFPVEAQMSYGDAEVVVIGQLLSVVGGMGHPLIAYDIEGRNLVVMVAKPDDKIILLEQLRKLAGFGRVLCLKPPGCLDQLIKLLPATPIKVSVVIR